MKIKKNIKILLYILIFSFSIYNIWYSFDLVISEMSLSNGGDSVALYSIPSINIKVENIWDNPAINDDIIGEWFIKCIESNSQNTIFKSASMNSFMLYPDNYIIAWNIKLPDTLTQTQRSVTIQCEVNQNWNYSSIFTTSESDTTNNSTGFTFNVDKVWRFDSSMDRAIKPIKGNLDAAEPNSLLWWWDSIRSFVFNKIINVVTPIIIIVGIAIGIIWAYKLFFSSSADETKKWIQLVIYWMLGIIIILSSRYIWNIIFQEMFNAGDASTINWVELASIIYNQIAYPFIKILIYLVLWVLFVILAWKVVWLISKSDGSWQKKAGNIIAWSAISMLLIIAAKQIVEAIYGKQDDVLYQSAQNLWELGGGILSNKSIPILYSVINWIMWITALVVLVIIIFQAFQILTNPDKAENWQKLGKSILYIFIWILIIWTGYVLTNFLIIN